VTRGFALDLPPRLRFGRGEAIAAVPEIAARGPRLVLVHGRNAERCAPLDDALARAGARLHRETCEGEPDLPMLTGALARARGFEPDAVVALGGGAVLDLGKALAALLPAPDPDPLEHLEVVGKGRPLSVAPLPFVAIPTTAGTGAEATRNAVIGVPAHRRKVSLRDPRMTPCLAVVDPSLTDATPRGVTMASGLDAVTQVIEPYLSARANPVTDALCRSAIPRGLQALAALSRAEEPAARDALALTAWESGVALANAGLGAVHGVAGVLGGLTGAPHGALCGQLLSPVLQLTRGAAAAGSETAARVSEIDGWCRSALGCGIDGLARWAQDAGLPQPEGPLPAEKARRVAEMALASSSMRASAVALDSDDLFDALAEAGWA
jgi:alcohol dehydrogenase class IV